VATVQKKEEGAVAALCSADVELAAVVVAQQEQQEVHGVQRCRRRQWPRRVLLILSPRG
jgi:hypothetical protein